MLSLCCGVVSTAVIEGAVALYRLILRLELHRLQACTRVERAGMRCCIACCCCCHTTIGICSRPEMVIEVCCISYRVS